MILICPSLAAHAECLLSLQPWKYSWLVAADPKDSGRNNYFRNSQFQQTESRPITLAELLRNYGSLCERILLFKMVLEGSAISPWLCLFQSLLKVARAAQSGS